MKKIPESSHFFKLLRKNQGTPFRKKPKISNQLRIQCKVKFQRRGTILLSLNAQNARIRLKFMKKQTQTQFDQFINSVSPKVVPFKCFFFQQYDFSETIFSYPPNNNANIIPFLTLPSQLQNSSTVFSPTKNVEIDFNKKTDKENKMTLINN